MPQSNVIDIRAMYDDAPEGVPRKRLYIKRTGNPVGDIFDVTSLGELSREKISKFLREHYNDFITPIRWPRWLK
jgi:hypothetical protein